MKNDERKSFYEGDEHGREKETRKETGKQIEKKVRENIITETRNYRKRKK